MARSGARWVELRWNPPELDGRWQKRWAEDHLHRVLEDDPRPKWYELPMYPYPSGDLHIGHWYMYAPSDCHARFRQMQGYNVLHPMGFDAFGLPAENAAIRQGVHPRSWTMQNIEKMRRQLRSMGAMYDWDREIVCCQPDYYGWNQWLFLQLFKKGLAYRNKAPAVWCPSCETVLANEQVVEGLCERCQTPITRREMEQWFLSITQYAEELLDFDGLIDWPENILTMQRNWIGRSHGTEVAFDISHLGLAVNEFRVFTTRIDTLYGVTFIVLAPEHPLVSALTTPDQRSVVSKYVEEARHKSDIERLSAEREKTGVHLGTYCVNPVNGEQVPILTADYAVAWYAQGAVMGVPAHDQRDFEFAAKYHLPIRIVISPPDWNEQPLSQAYTGQGIQVNSGDVNGIPNLDGLEVIADRAEIEGWGKRTVIYRLRDWLISRQRYWGTPIPIIHCPGCGTVPVPEMELPVLLPEEAEFKPTGESPLKRHQEFLNTSCPQCGSKAERETDTMDTFFDSSWYFLRYLDPNNAERPWKEELARKWVPIDQYTGGSEHAIMHLLYARFFTKALRDMDLVSFDEPFLRLFNQGHIIYEGAKMSKSRGNVITPDPYVKELGADIVRTYLMFIGPWDHGGEWSDSGINGVARWFNRIWDLFHKDPRLFDLSSPDESRTLERRLHQTIRRVDHDLDAFKFNTAIAALMELSNHLQDVWEKGLADQSSWLEARRIFLLMLAPMAPHLAEELWERTGHQYSIHQQQFPTWNDALAADQLITLVVQVNGRVRDRFEVVFDISEQDATAQALARDNVQRHIGKQRINKTIYVPGRLVNFVTA
jgi:leucyl-tRNA synthetase